MGYCIHCKVSVSGNRKSCPLCRCPLDGEQKGGEEIFPAIRPLPDEGGFFLRLVGFIAIAASVVSVAINFIAPAGGWWSLFAVAGVACAYLTILVGVTKKYNLLKNITWQLFIISALAVLWDVATGWKGWSIDYVIPSGCVASMASMAIIARLRRLPAGDYIVYMILDGIYGVVPIVFILTQTLSVVYPSIICAAVSLLSICALLLFEGRNMREEIERIFHL